MSFGIGANGCEAQGLLAIALGLEAIDKNTCQGLEFLRDYGLQGVARATTTSCTW